MNPVEVQICMGGAVLIPQGGYCQWLVDMVLLEGEPPPPGTYAGIVLALMLAGI